MLSVDMLHKKPSKYPTPFSFLYQVNMDMDQKYIYIFFGKMGTDIENLRCGICDEHCIAFSF